MTIGDFAILVINQQEHLVYINNLINDIYEVLYGEFYQIKYYLKKKGQE